MELDIFQVDAFTSQIFSGNPAAVCPLTEWLTDEAMQNIAMENSLAETAFFVPSNDGFEIKWFTPDIEMDLCGHATLASAHVIARHLGYNKPVINFSSNSGPLEVSVSDKLLSLNLPSRMPVLADAPKEILQAFHIKPKEILKARDYLLVYESEEDILNLAPDRTMLDKINLGPGGVIVTAKGKYVDFVSRFFTPQAHAMEDAVTGSAHCSLIPYWSDKLNKNELSALQVSSRRGVLQCRNDNDRVIISGEAITYMVGTLFL